MINFLCWKVTLTAVWRNIWTWKGGRKGGHERPVPWWSQRVTLTRWHLGTDLDEISQVFTSDGGRGKCKRSEAGVCPGWPSPNRATGVSGVELDTEVDTEVREAVGSQIMQGLGALTAESPTVPVCPGLRGFLGCGTFGAKVKRTNPSIRQTSIGPGAHHTFRGPWKCFNFIFF